MNVSICPSEAQDGRLNWWVVYQLGRKLKLPVACHCTQHNRGFCYHCQEHSDCTRSVGLCRDITCQKGEHISTHDWLLCPCPLCCTLTAAPASTHTTLPDCVISSCVGPIHCTDTCSASPGDDWLARGSAPRSITPTPSPLLLVVTTKTPCGGRQQRAGIFGKRNCLCNFTKVHQGGMHRDKE